MKNSRIFLAIGLLCLAGCSTLPTAQRVRSADTTHSYVLAGEGAPTIVMEAGLGDGKESWASVYDQLSQVSKVFAYDRAGYGASRSRNRTRDGATIVDELRAQLKAIGLKPPYVLVGHSIGGTYLELYARTYPEDVAGVVLVDSRHADFTRQCLAAKAGNCEPPAFALALMPDALRREFVEGERTMQQVLNAGPFPDVPLAVLTSGKVLFSSSVFRETWLQTQKSLAAMSRTSVHTVCEDCGHYIQKDKPELVVKAVRDIVSVASDQ